MGSTMLHGVLNMPPDLWDDTPLDQSQRHARYIQASKRIIDLELMLAKKLDLIKCGIATNYSGDPFENKLYTEASDLLVDKPGE